MRPLGLLPNPFEPYGIKFSLSYIGDLLANLDGGMRRGAVYEGRLNAAVDLDFAKLAGARGSKILALTGRRQPCPSSGTSNNRSGTLSAYATPSEEPRQRRPPRLFHLSPHLAGENDPAPTSALRRWSPKLTRESPA
jgi:carbohydrate-selective porin OprB